MASVNKDEKTLNKLLWEEYGIGMDAGVTKLKLGGPKVALEGLGPIIGPNPNPEPNNNPNPT
jgi:hypothetical protein